LVLECEDFNTIDAFRFLDKEGKGFIEPHELIISLRQDLNIDFQELENDVIMFFQKVDKQETRKMKYSEFCSAFAPKDKNQLKTLAARVPRNIHLSMSFEEMFSQRTQ
jgi:hypothetical protein